jgi:hypothetical protein
MREETARGEDDGELFTVTARAAQCGDDAAAGEGFSGVGEGSRGTRCQRGVKSACLDNATEAGAVGRDETSTGAAQSAATSMPASRSPP